MQHKEKYESKQNKVIVFCLHPSSWRWLEKKFCFSDLSSLCSDCFTFFKLIHAVIFQRNIFSFLFLFFLECKDCLPKEYFMTSVFVCLFVFLFSTFQHIFLILILPCILCLLSGNNECFVYVHWSLVPFIKLKASFTPALSALGCPMDYPVSNFLSLHAHTQFFD